MPLLLRRTSILAALLFATSLSACSDEPDNRVLTTLSIKLSKPFAVVGQTIQATAVGLDQNGKAMDPGPVVWSTLSSAAKVSAAGVITGVYQGSSVIKVSVKDGELSSQQPLSVSATSAMKLSPNSNFVTRNGVPFDHWIWFTNADNIAFPIAGVKLTATISGGGTITGPDTATSTYLGTAVFRGRVITGASGKRTITYTAEGFEPVTTTVTVVSGVAKNIAVVSGDNQTGVKGGDVGPVTAQVTDADGYPVANVPVTFAVASGGGSVPIAFVIVTDANGIAAQYNWKLGSVGVNTLTATAQGVSTPVTFTSIARPRVQRVELSYASPTVQVGQAVQAAVSAFDDTGAPYVPQSSIVWAVQSDQFAKVTPTGLVIGTSAGTPNVIVRVDGLATSAFVTVTGAPTQKLVVSNVPSSIRSGTQFPDAIVVRIVDAVTGLPIAEAGHTVIAAISAPTQADTKFTGQSTATTDATGTARFAGIGVSSPGYNMQLNFRSDGIIPGTVNFFVTTGAPASLVLEAGNNQSGVAGDATPVRPSVRILDDAGSTLPPGTPVTFTVSSGGGQVTNATVLTAEGGIATVGSWILGAVGKNTLTASTPGVAGTVVFTATAKPF